MIDSNNNKTSICSIVFLDIIDYSKKTDSEQIEVKNHFNSLINHALKGVAENDRIILDTGDGAAITCNGSPEDVLFTSLNIRDEIIRSNIHAATPLYVRFGINLGPVRVVQDINGRPNVIGDGINVAQRIMSFANPNQILVSRSYYEVTSRLTQEISQMFDYSGIKQDKHVREHEIYSVRLLKRQTEYKEQAFDDDNNRFADVQTAPSVEINWRFVALALPALIAFFLIIKNASEPLAPELAAKKESIMLEQAKQQTKEKDDRKTAETTKQKSADKKSKPKETATNTENSEKQTTQEKSQWAKFKESLKKGSEAECTPAQAAMSQCK